MIEGLNLIFSDLKHRILWYNRLLQKLMENQISIDPNLKGSKQTINASAVDAIKQQQKPTGK